MGTYIKLDGRIKPTLSKLESLYSTVKSTKCSNGNHNNGSDSADNASVLVALSFGQSAPSPGVFLERNIPTIARSAKKGYIAAGAKLP